MAPTKSRDEILKSLREQVANGKPIVGAGAGIGLSAKFIEAGGGDLIIIYNSGRFRMAGRGSLAGLMPYGNANDVVLDMANEVLPVVKHTPVLAGVCGTDPFRDTPRFLAQLKDLGFAGVQNFPTVGLIDGNFRANLEETGMSYDLEVDMIRQARKLDLLTTPYVFNVEESKKMASAGADILVAHMGLTTSGSIGASTGKTLDESVALIQDIRDAAVKINPEILVLCHGGPIAAPEDARFDEAQSMMAIREAGFPCPKVISVGSHPHSTSAPASILMTRIPGEQLDDVYHELRETKRTAIVDEISRMVEIMRAWKSPWGLRICRISGGSIRSIRVPNHQVGPCESEKDFNDYLLAAASPHSFKSREDFQSSLQVARRLNEVRHRIVFTHGDFFLHNILVDNGHVTGFIDWESAGWYPEYWEFTTPLRWPARDPEGGSLFMRLGGEHYPEELESEKALMALTVDSWIFIIAFGVFRNRSSSELGYESIQPKAAPATDRREGLFHGSHGMLIEDMIQDLRVEPTRENVEGLQNYLENMGHSNIKTLLQSMKYHQNGFTHIGKDGVLRVIHSQTYEVIDARGLRPQEITELLDFLPKDKMVAEDYQGLNGTKVTSYEDLYRPAEGILPKKPSEAEALERRRFIEEQKQAFRETKATGVEDQEKEAEAKEDGAKGTQ
ncbi:hypothetical protein HJFPF1_05548 [Paramyrothecium foliicola]|nr:hypothetical protein HJFPF1_05548 [Paramyrothecium foliicola]